MSVTPFPAADTAASEPEPSGSDLTVPHARFGMPHALVLIVCVVTAAVLVGTGTSVGQALALVGGAVCVGAVALVLIVTGGREGGRFDRFMDAYKSSKS